MHVSICLAKNVCHVEKSEHGIPFLSPTCVASAIKRDIWSTIMGPPGTVPTKTREDRDAVGHPSRQVAVNGPPVMRTFPPRGRARGRAVFNRVSGRGGGNEAGGRSGFHPLPPRPRAALMDFPLSPGTNGNGAGPSKYREERSVI